MKVVVAGGGVAGLAAALRVARAGHEAVVIERDSVAPEGSPRDAFGVGEGGFPIAFSHAWPRAEASGPRQPGDEDLMYLWFDDLAQQQPCAGQVHSAFLPGPGGDSRIDLAVFTRSRQPRRGDGPGALERVPTRG